MKKLFILLLSVVILTGCSKVTTDVAMEQVSSKESQNLIIEDIVIETATEEEFVTYIDSIDYQVEVLTAKEELTTDEKTTLENTFITLTDFIFYGGTINGKTFAKLTTEAKQQVLSIYEKIDSKIESKIPGYKEKISETATKSYEDIKTKISQLKEEIKNQYIEDYGQDKYAQVEQAHEEGKEALTESVESTYSVIVDVTMDFYEETKNKAENWYKNYKESRN